MTVAMGGEDTSAAAAGLPPAVQLYQLTTGAWVAQAISVAARLGVADAVSGASRSCDDIAADVGAHGPSLYRLLRALSDYGVFEEQPGQRFALTPLGEVLRSDAPSSMRGWAIMTGARFHRDAWSELETSVRTGKPSFSRVHGVQFFDYLAAHPDDSAVFNAAMKNISTNFLAGIIAVYDFSPFTTIVDVGGGTGALLAAILQANPAARGTLVDTEQVVVQAPAVLDAAGVGDRCGTVVGDFFEQMPSGADLYLLSNIIHDWGDDKAIEILRVCRDAMSTHSRLLIIELVLPDDRQPSMGKLLDLEMLSVTPNGRQRTAGEYEALLATAGLRRHRVVAAVPQEPASYVEAVLD